MNCDRYPLLGFARGELSSDSAGRMAAHVAGCKTCEQRLRVVVALQEYYGGRQLRWRRPGWLVAAAALAVAVATVALERGLAPGRTPHAPTLAEELPYPLVLLSNRSEVDADRRAAYQAYRDGNYARAERLLGESTLAIDLFLRGVSLYLLGREEEALPLLRRVPPEDVWSDPARWYEANALLRLDRWGEARRLLSRLSVEPGEYSSRAASLLQRQGEGP